MFNIIFSGDNNMFTTNPFAVLSSTVPSIALQGFVLLMLALVAIGTLMDIIHKKNEKYLVKEILFRCIEQGCRHIILFKYGQNREGL